MSLVSRKLCIRITVGLILIQLGIILLSEIRIHIPTMFFFNHWLQPVGERVYRDDEPAESFLQLHRRYCEQNFFPDPSNIAATFAADYNNSLCDCVPSGLTGHANTDEAALKTLKPGGSWSPVDCVARHRVAVIIPYRDRSEHLTILLSVLHPMLRRQLLDYTVFVVEQASPEVFNKAALMNAGFLEASSQGHFDCFVFHDVDMIPEDDRNLYTCHRAPRHIGSHLAQWDYRLLYDQLFGGVTAFTRQQFVKINGFSNQFYGWGGEDDDMFARVRANGFSVVRFPRAVARFHMIQHSADRRNPYNIRSTSGFLVRPQHYAKDGISSLRYQRVALELRPTYTWVSVALPDPPANFRSYQRVSSGAVQLTASQCALMLLALTHVMFALCLVTHGWTLATIITFD